MPTLEELFASFKRTAFRFEGLAAYDMAGSEEEANFRRYLNGESALPTPTSEWADWLSSLKQWTNDGIVIQRVRMVPVAFSAYVTCELEWAFPFNIAAGEKVSVISEMSVRKLAPSIPPDFWIFDSTRVAILKYSEKGAWSGADILDSEIDSYITLAKQLVNFSVDYRSYLSTKRQTGRFP